MRRAADDDEPTLGARLADQARALMAHRIDVVGWLPALQPAMARALALPTPAQSRRLRREDAVRPLTAGSDVPHGGTPMPSGPRPAPPTPSGAAGQVSAAGTSQGPGATPLQAHVAARLRPYVGHHVTEARMRDDEAADALARAHDADAVTVGEEIHFRSGRFRPDTPTGLALLVHEATHVVEALRPGSAWRRATSTSAAAEEAAALAQEHRALMQRHEDLPRQRSDSQPTRRPGQARAAPVTDGDGPARHPRGHDAPLPTSAGAAPAERPMPAREDRDAARSQPALPTGRRELEEAVMRDVLRRLRTDAERGA